MNYITKPTMTKKIVSFALISSSLLCSGLISNIKPSFSQSANQFSFFCKPITDSTGMKITATLAWSPERQGNVRIIGWKSEYFSKKGWNPQKRCQEVTPKFQQAINQNRTLLTAGKVQGYPVICAVSQEGQTCNSNNQLFTIKPNDNPELVLQQLMGILTGKASDMLMQSSSGHTYVSLKQLLDSAPLVDSDAPKCTQSAGTFASCQP